MAEGWLNMAHGFGIAAAQGFHAANGFADFTSGKPNAGAENAHGCVRPFVGLLLVVVADDDFAPSLPGVDELRTSSQKSQYRAKKSP